MYNEYIGVIFDGSLEGFFCIVYDHYYKKLNPSFILEDGDFQPTLGTKYIHMDTNMENASKVTKAISSKLSEASLKNIYYTFLNSDPDRFIELYNYILLGFKVGKELDNYLKMDCVIKVRKYSGYTSKEAERMLQFSRFAETKTGVYYTDIAPVNNVLPLVAEFFMDRFGPMNWVIHDVKRGIAAFYNTEECIFRELSDDFKLVYSEKEKDYQELWKILFKTIGIKERKNPKVQNMYLPKRYRKYMTEFK